MKEEIIYISISIFVFYILFKNCKEIPIQYQEIPIKPFKENPIPLQKIISFQKNTIPSQEIPSQEIPSQEIPSQEITSQEITSQEIPSQEITSQEITSQEIPFTQFKENNLSSSFNLDDDFLYLSFN